MLFPRKYYESSEKKLPVENVKPAVAQVTPRGAATSSTTLSQRVTDRLKTHTIKIERQK